MARIMELKECSSGYGRSFFLNNGLTAQVISRRDCNPNLIIMFAIVQHYLLYDNKNNSRYYL
jgi:hypothetical protein